MFTPAYKITLGGKVIDTTTTPKESTVVDLRVALDLDTPADSFTLVLGQVGGVQPAPGVETKIALGYVDDSQTMQVRKGAIAIKHMLVIRMKT